MSLRLPAIARDPGLCHAATPDGVSLPVIDITHPAFAAPSAAALLELRQKLERESADMERVPATLQRLGERAVLSTARMGRGILGARGRFLDGITTYLMKLGPENLGGWASPVDRAIAGSFAPACMRLRLHHMAALLATGLAPALGARPTAPLHVLDIAGGPSSDALNALLLLRRDVPGALERRRIVIHVLDQDEAGPLFAARCLDALCSGGPLAGLDVLLQHVPHEWSDRPALQSLLAGLDADAVVAACSEGGLLEYGDDEAIAASLEALRDGAPEDGIFVGSVTRADAGPLLVNRTTRVQTRPRTLESFRALAGRCGFVLDRVEETPLSYDVRLARASGAGRVPT